MVPKEKTDKNIHKISWPMKLALALAFMPICCLIIALTFKLPLPTLPFVNLIGFDNQPEYIFFFAYSAKNIPISVTFALLCFTLGIGLFSWLAIDRGSFNQACKDLVKNLRDDISNIFWHNNAKKSQPTQKINKQEKKEPIRKIIWIGKPKKN